MLCQQYINSSIFILEAMANAAKNEDKLLSQTEKKSHDI